MVTLGACTQSDEKKAEKGMEEQPAQMEAMVPEETGKAFEGPMEGFTLKWSYPVVDTAQNTCYDEKGTVIDPPTSGDPLFGQDAQYSGIKPSYEDNGDGTVTDLNTGLIWEKSPEFKQYKYRDAGKYCEDLTVGGRTNWRLPSVKELFSLTDFRGKRVSGEATELSIPYIDTQYFTFRYNPELPMATNFWTSTMHVKGPLIDDTAEGVFGVNFAHGTIKAYVTGYRFDDPTQAIIDPIYYQPSNYIRCVCDDLNKEYGENAFVDNGDQTVTDKATGLMWQQADDRQTRDWFEALQYAEKLNLAGHTDWRLPNVKELQSIVDYEKLNIPAIEETFFRVSNPDSWFWTSTTNGDKAYNAMYICFGKAYAKLPEQTEFYNHHGAGAERSAPKRGDISDYDQTSVNATDETRIRNYVRCVRDAG